MHGGCGPLGESRGGRARHLSPLRLAGLGAEGVRCPRVLCACGGENALCSRVWREKKGGEESNKARLRVWVTLPMSRL